jgi:hypothetical protein
MRWMSQSKFAAKEVSKILAEYGNKVDLVRAMSFYFWLRLTAPLNTKNDELAVAISAAAHSILMGAWFDSAYHDRLAEQCEEGYEAGFIVRDIIHASLSEEEKNKYYAR